MSSNLLKGVYTSLQHEDKRVIDTNGLVEKRIEELAVKMSQNAPREFVAGLAPDVAEVLPELFEDGENGEGIENSQKVIKASEEAKKILSDAKSEAESIIAGAKEEAAGILERGKRDAEGQKAAIMSSAREQGYQEGLDKASAELEERKIAYSKLEKELEQQYQDMIDELEPKFIDTITGIYDHIFNVELKSYREILTYLISTTMSKIEGNRNFIIHVSKEDYPYISMQKKQIAAGTASLNNSVEMVEDLTLSKNQCFIETDGGIFDCGLDTQLAELTQKLKILSYEKR